MQLRIRGAVAFIVIDAVYNKLGQQVGWFYGDHIRNLRGQVILVFANSRIDGLAMPPEKSAPSKVPTLRLLVAKPNFRRLTMRPSRKHEWADVESLLFRHQKSRVEARIAGFLTFDAETKIEKAIRV